MLTSFMQLNKYKSRFFLTGMSLAICLTAPTSFATVPEALEPDYAEAVLAYNGKNYDRALQVLNELLKQSPDTSEFLELKALTLKTADKPQESAQVYTDLIKAKAKEGKPPKESAPYYFELGIINFKDKKHGPAKDHLQEAIKYDFNTGAAHFFIGMMEFKDGNWSASKEHFNGVLSSNAQDLKPASHFYLAQTNFKLKNASAATQHFNSAISLSDDVIADEKAPKETKQVAIQIRDASKKALAPLDKSQFFGNVALLTAYDSNVLTLPTSVDTSATGKSSVKEMLQFGLGYMTSPVKTIQLVPNYRGAFNYNFNRNTRSGEYFSNFLSLYVNRKPLNPFTYGLKLEGAYTFQNSVDPETDKGTFRPYSITASIGPYFKTQLSASTQLGGEIFGGPQNYKQDSSTSSDSRRTGFLTQGRIYVQNDSGSRIWNPTLSFAVSVNNTRGSEYRSKGWTVGLSDQLYLGSDLKLVINTSYAKADYNVRSAGPRNDKTYAVQIASSYKLSRRFTLLSDASYTTNQSNIPDTYAYNRYVFSAGLSWSMF